MRLLLVFVAIVILIALATGDTENQPAPVNPLVDVPTPTCPGGECPQPHHLTEPTLVPEQLLLPNFAPARTEVSLLVPNRLVEPTPTEAKPAAKLPPPPTSVIAANGWRLRLLVPPDKGERASILQSAFETDHWCQEFAKKYGYQVIRTDQELFRPWKNYRYPEDKITLVLINASGKVVYFAPEYRLPKNVDELRLALGKAVAPPPIQQERREPDCTCVIPSHQPSPSPFSPGKTSWRGY